MVNTQFEEDEKPELKLIVTKYNGKCTSCGKVLPAGSSAYYGRTDMGSVLICMSCQVDTGSGKGLAARYQKVRELNIVIRDLTKKANDLSDLVSDLETENNLKDMAFKTVEKNKESAPGELTVAEMRSFYEVLGV